MKIGCPFALLLAGSLTGMAQDDMLNLDDLLSAGKQWLQENVDENVWRSLENVDQDKVKALFNDLQRRFAGEYIVNLAPLKQTAAALLPLLESHEETKPYAGWLKTRMDYFDVADEFRIMIPPPKSEPGQPLRPIPNPAPDIQRKVWQKQVEKRPMPKGALAYAARLKPIFTSQHIPGQLVWLAEVESSFNPDARSPAGAAGLYQLMPATAKQLGLSLRPQDERLQPEKSARAAAKYLSYLGGKFKDWPLALAAYNAGEGTVQKLLTRHQATTFDRIAIYLPAETQMYVPKMDATIRRREGITLSQLTRPE